jgi:hypothetical protein
VGLLPQRAPVRARASSTRGPVIDTDYRRL